MSIAPGKSIWPMVQGSCVWVKFALVGHAKKSTVIAANPIGTLSQGEMMEGWWELKRCVLEPKNPSPRSVACNDSS